MRIGRYGFAAAVLVVSTAQGSGRAATTPDLRIAGVQVVEGDSGERAVEVMLSLSQPAPTAVSVRFASRDGTAVAGSDYRATSGTATFAIGESATKITVAVVGDTAIEADEAFEIAFGPAAGATLVDDTATAVIVNDDFPPGGPSVYEVRLSYVGSTGFMEGAPDCPVRRNGKVVLTGLVSGYDRVKSEDDIRYTGTLASTFDIDLCENRRDGGIDRLCGITVVAGGPLNAELLVYEGDRGGYIKATQVQPARWRAVMFGSCEPSDIADERTQFPDDSIANIFNGHDLPLRSGPLQPGQYRQGAVLVEVLRVVRRQN